MLDVGTTEYVDISFYHQLTRNLLLTIHAQPVHHFIKKNIYKNNNSLTIITIYNSYNLKIRMAPIKNIHST